MPIYGGLITQTKKYPVTEPRVKITDEDYAVIIYAGGTTGMAKGATRKHKDVLKLGGPFAMLKGERGTPMFLLYQVAEHLFWLREKRLDRS